MHFVEASKCKGIILLKSCCVELLDERVYLQHVVSVTVISSAHIKGNSILGKMLILWEIHGKNKKQKTNASKSRLKSNCEPGNLSWFGKRFFLTQIDQSSIKTGVIYYLLKLIIDGIG